MRLRNKNDPGGTAKHESWATRLLAAMCRPSERNAAMVEKTVTISLTAKELMDLEAIVVDEDKEEALRFLREVVKKKVFAAEEGHCRPPSDWR
jgi:hypothetical protein